MRMPMRHLVLGCALTVAVASGPGAQTAAFDPSLSDEKAVAIADEVLKTIGAETFSKVRFLKFRYTKMQGEEVREERVHIWDREARRSHLEAPTSKTRKPVVIVIDHKTGQGQATVDGQPATGESGDKLMADAKKYFNEDILWLVTPFRLKEPGAKLRYEGEKVAGPVTYDMITASFEDSPDVKFRFYVNRQTKMVETLAFVLKGRNVTPLAFDWSDWTSVSGMKFSLRKSQAGGEVQIVLDGIEVFSDLPETVFTSTEPFDAASLAAASP